jgi:hypothetical protein
LSTLYVITLQAKREGVGQHFQNILSGDKDYTNKIILNTNTLGFKRVFFANSYLQMFVFHHFLPQKQAFLSPEVPEGQKRDKKIRPSSAWGTNEGQI